MTLLSPAATAAAPAPSGGDFSSEQTGAALLAMLQSTQPVPAAVSVSTPVAPASSSRASSTPAKVAKAPKGVTLERGEAIYEVGAVGAAARKQTKVTAITIYTTDPGQQPVLASRPIACCLQPATEISFIFAVPLRSIASVFSRTFVSWWITYGGLRSVHQGFFVSTAFAHTQAARQIV